MSREKDQYVNVFVRVKPLNKTQTPEKCATTMQIVSDKEIIVAYNRTEDRSQDKISKKFTFDKVFGPMSTQVDVYDMVISPLLKEVLAGYNCTVFAYGQTGTGKTYTMEGGRAEDSNWQSDTSAGMIPRCLSHLFGELQLLENQQYAVRVNFLEIYNEELFDLLNSNEVCKIKLYEDVSKKGSVIIRGLEEVTVRDKVEVYKILERGLEKRQTAATLMNANSNRSHTVFSITIHTKEHTADGEELLKTAKLNLVDLAGSENISKSGAVDKRARETRNINQSLLTLGRVITALVEKAPHVPYRESKLTRLLQESLGGRTKTSIIATISSASSDIEETLSTLDYACRAKHIANRPEINQKLHKRALLKEYTEQVERLRKDLIATRERNGIYISQDKYDSMHELMEWQRKEIKESINDLRTLEENLDNRTKIHNDTQLQYNTQIDELTKKTEELSDLMYSLQSMQTSLKQIEDDAKEQEYLANNYAETEKTLHDQAKTVLNVLDEALNHAQRLHDKLDRKIKAEKESELLGLQIKEAVTKSMKNIEDRLAVRTKEIECLFSSVKNEVENHITTQAKSMETSISSIVETLINEHLISSNKATNDMNTFYACYKKALNKDADDASNMIEYETTLSNAICSRLVPNIHDLLKDNGSFVKNLQILNNKVSQKLEDISIYMTNTIETVYKYHLEEYNNIRKNLSEISEHINCMLLNKKQILENYKTFAKKMEDLSHEVMLLGASRKNYSENVNLSHQVVELCNSMHNQISRSSNESINAYNNLKEFTQNTISQIKGDVDSSINQIQVLSGVALGKRNVLASDLEKCLSIGCATLKQYNNKAKFNKKQLQKEMITNKNKIIETNTVISKLIEDTDYTHVTFMEKQQEKLSNLSTIIDNKLTDQNMKLNNSNDEIIKELSASQQQIDKFSIENLRHDVVTGTTPPRKQFLYPRQFATSSRERLIQKFRENQNHIEEAENLDSTAAEVTASAKQSSVSNASKNNISTKRNRPLYVTSTPFNITQSNIYSPNAADKFIPSLNLSRLSPIHSEEEIHTEEINQENRKFVKSRKVKSHRQSGVKKEKRHLLETRK